MVGSDFTSSNGAALLKDRKISTSALIPAIVVTVLWAVFLLDRAYQLDLYRFGLLPRTFRGLLGIITAPFLHGDAEHLLNNSIPLMVLGTALLYFFPRVAGRVVLVSWIFSGLWVWISARSNYHIGASGVVYGLAAFLFTSGLIRNQRTLMGLSLLVVFLYGSLLWGIFPIVPRVSWESHFWGAAAGVVMAYLYRKVPAAVQDPKPITWDEDEEDGGTEIPIPTEQPWHTTTTWDATPSTMEKSHQDPS